MGSDRESDTRFVKRLATEKGFELVGVAEANPLDDEVEHLREWLSRGYQASMRWMESNVDKRGDPGRVLDGARSVISLGKNYYTPFQHEAFSAKISRYAWGDDYHLVLGKILKEYVAELSSKFPANKFIWYSDTGPVMDKAWARRAGIGWIGKHTNVINREIGSWIFLAEVITDLDFVYDLPETDHCGSCRACIDACPTDAIVEPYVVDANRCISFLTIENRDETIPAGLIPKLDNWLFGCDICQDVCPWNRKFATTSDEQSFLPREENLNLKPRDIHLMNRDEFAERFRRSPVRRAKYEGLQRNAAALSAAPQSKEQKSDE